MYTSSRTHWLKNYFAKLQINNFIKMSMSTKQQIKGEERHTETIKHKKVTKPTFYLFIFCNWLLTNHVTHNT